MSPTLSEYLWPPERLEKRVKFQKTYNFTRFVFQDKPPPLSSPTTHVSSPYCNIHSASWIIDEQL